MGIASKLEIRRTIKLSLTAEDWEIYRDPEVGDFERAAKMMNIRLAIIINNSSSCSEARRECGELLHSYREFGATDSEPRRVLEQILDQFFTHSLASIH